MSVANLQVSNKIFYINAWHISYRPLTNLSKISNMLIFFLQVHWTPLVVSYWHVNPFMQFNNIGDYISIYLCLSLSLTEQWEQAPSCINLRYLDKKTDLYTYKRCSKNWPKTKGQPDLHLFRSDLGEEF